MATHSSILAWRIPGTEGPGGLPSVVSHRVKHDLSDLAAAASICCSVMFDSATPWTVCSPLSMEISRQEYWSGLPVPSPGDLPDPGTEPGSPAFQADSLPFEPPGKPHTSKKLGGGQEKG